MGVKQRNFFQWIETTFEGSVKEIGPEDVGKFEGICIDVNALIHTCMRIAPTEKKFVKLLYFELDRSIRLATPQAFVYLAVDGSPPLAKMQEQIRRRKAKSAGTKKSPLDGSSITPGTSFMLRVTPYLHRYAQKYLLKRSWASRLSFIVDGAETPGEGEAKIMKFLDRNASQLRNSWVAVFSGDSDVILQSILSQVPNICVIRLSPEGHTGVSVPELRKQISAQCKCDLTQQKEIRKIVIDFGVLVMFSGNDYMRKLRGATITKAWPAYKTYQLDCLAKDKRVNRHLITTGNSIDLEVLHEILVRIRRLSNRRVFKPDLSLSLAMLGINVAQPTCLQGNGVEGETDDVDNEDDDSDAEDPDVQQITPEQKLANYTKHIPNYLEALLWTLNMYSSGVCPNPWFSQVGRLISIEQVLTAISRDMSHRSTFTMPFDGSAVDLKTMVSTITLLPVSKVSLIPDHWRAAFQSDKLHALCRSLVYGASLIDENDRIRTLLYLIGQAMIPLIDTSANIVRHLLFPQCPIVISGSLCSRPGSMYLSPPTGNEFPEIWKGQDTKMPELIDTSTLVILAYDSSEFDECNWYYSPSNERTTQSYIWPIRRRRIRAPTDM